MITPSASRAAFAAVQNLPPRRQVAAGSADAAAARDALASFQNATRPDAIEARLAKIKTRDALSRTDEDMAFLLANDKRLAEINSKNAGSRTADEIDYVQKAGGFVNTMRNLSDGEKALYDELVAQGNTLAAEGIANIAFIREMGHMAGGPDGTTYDPLNTEITAENVLHLFRHSIVDPTGRAESQFQALAQYLQTRQAKA